MVSVLLILRMSYLAVAAERLAQIGLDLDAGHWVGNEARGLMSEERLGT